MTDRQWILELGDGCSHAKAVLNFRSESRGQLHHRNLFMLLVCWSQGAGLQEGHNLATELPESHGEADKKIHNKVKGNSGDLTGQESCVLLSLPQIKV